MTLPDEHDARRGLTPDLVDPDTLVVVANRLPVEYHVSDGWRRSPGGLVSAMEAVLRDRDTVWIGWSGRFSDDIDESTPPTPDATGSIQLADVELSRADVAGHYEGFSNSALWPLYHGGIVPPVYHRSEFEAFRSVNARFAREVAERAPKGAMVWVHDYQLQLVPAMVRHHRPDLRIGFFLHIPFPPVELFLQLPWRKQVVEGLLGADVIGFQTPDGAHNFARLARRLLGVGETGDGHLLVHEQRGSRQVLVEAFPIGIRADDYADLAADPQTVTRAAELRASLGDPELLLLGVDRLDYTKGIDVRIRAVTELFLDGFLDADRTVFVQVATPSRENVEEYRRIRNDVELLVSRANGDIGKIGITPIHYLHQPMSPDELTAAYVAADVMLVTPLCDGMNLVAKEYVACRTNADGALVLSEFTGAAEQMRESWLVNPYDIEGTKAAIMGAIEASATETRTRMDALRHGVFTDNVTTWADDFLAALRARTPIDETGL